MSLEVCLNDIHEQQQKQHRQTESAICLVVEFGDEVWQVGLIRITVSSLLIENTVN